AGSFSPTPRTCRCCRWWSSSPKRVRRGRRRSTGSRGATIGSRPRWRSVCAVPASTARGVLFEPALPEPQHEAIAHLRYGCATRLLLQFDRRFWRRAGRPDAFGTALETGAVWDGNEQQKGPQGILSFLAGGHASRGLQDLVHTKGERGVVDRLAWPG